jgi:hypothetical protein
MLMRILFDILSQSRAVAGCVASREQRNSSIAFGRYYEYIPRLVLGTYFVGRVALGMGTGFNAALVLRTYLVP